MINASLIMFSCNLNTWVLRLDRLARFYHDVYSHARNRANASDLASRFLIQRAMIQEESEYPNIVARTTNKELSRAYCPCKGEIKVQHTSSFQYMPCEKNY